MGDWSEQECYKKDEALVGKLHNFDFSLVLSFRNGPQRWCFRKAHMLGKTCLLRYRATVVKKNAISL